MDPERGRGHAVAHCTNAPLHIHDGFARSRDDLAPAAQCGGASIHEQLRSNVHAFTLKHVDRLKNVRRHRAQPFCFRATYTARFPAQQLVSGSGGLSDNGDTKCRI